MHHRYIDIVGGQAAGQPYARPTTLTLSSGDVVGCAHFSDMDLAAFGKVPVLGGADPEVEQEIGYTYDVAAGVARPILQPLPDEQRAALLAAWKAAAEAEVRRQSNAARDAFRTPGKDGVYLAKLREADRWEAAGAPPVADDTAYPHIFREVGITKPSAAELVALWRAMDGQWMAASAAIEGTEQGALKAIADPATADRAALDAILAALVWPQP